MSDPSVLIGAAASLVIVVGAVAGWLKEGRPKWRARQERERQKDFAILGGPVVDPLTGKQIGTQPPLGQWMADIKGDINHLAQIVGEHAELRRDVNSLDRRVKVLEDARAERLVTQAESAQMWRAIAERDIDNPGLTDEDE